MFKLGKKAPRRSLHELRAEKEYGVDRLERYLTVDNHSPRGRTAIGRVSGTEQIGGLALATATLITGNRGVPGRVITFYVGGVKIGTATTNQYGVANLHTTIGYFRPRRYSMAAIFGGDTSFAGSTGKGIFVVSVPSPNPPPVPPSPPPVPPPIPPSPGPLPDPTSVDWLSIVHLWQMLLNDSLGDCVIAGYLHWLQAVATNADKIFVPTDDMALQLYEKVGGYIPGKPETDNGAVIEDMINYAMVNALYGTPKVVAKLQFDPTNRKVLEQATDIFGGVLLGIAMPISSQKQTGPGLIWDVPKSGPTGDGKPGSWGGHCVYHGAYNQSLDECITWGAIQAMTRKFVTTYCDEGWVMVTEEWLQTSGESPSGFNKEQLLSDLNLL